MPSACALRRGGPRPPPRTSAGRLVGSMATHPCFVPAVQTKNDPGSGKNRGRALDDCAQSRGSTKRPSIQCDAGRLAQLSQRAICACRHLHPKRCRSTDGFPALDPHQTTSDRRNVFSDGLVTLAIDLTSPPSNAGYVVRNVRTAQARHTTETSASSRNRNLCNRGRSETIRARAA